MGVDWRELTYGTYCLVLAEWNDRHSADKPARSMDPAEADQLRAAMRAHGAM